MIKSSAPPHFVEPQDLGNRDWGSETLLGAIEGQFTLKRLLLKAGCKGGLQFHRKKDEMAIVISGELLVRFDDGTGNLTERVLKPGQVVRFPPGVVHQEEAISDCELIEVSTPYLNDRVRVEAMYGLPENGGLPTTQAEEIESI